MHKFFKVVGLIAEIGAIIGWAYYTVKGDDLTALWWLGALILAGVNAIRVKLNNK